MVIIFDLDDTLYEELTFVRSGFQAVADYLSPLLGKPQSLIMEGLNAELQLGRNNVFNRFLHKLDKKNEAIINACVRVYRGHSPLLHLFPEAEACLINLQSYPLYVVTDGNHLVQRKKIKALGLDFLVRRSFFTYAHGLHRRKPSPYCFTKICALEKVNPVSALYVGDNPYKDFVGIKPLGFQTIRVLTGPYANVTVDPVYEADYTIRSLAELDAKLLQKLHNS
ncbi:MAG: HAD family hydrolase [Parachlamydiaceae bacterium]